jgi:hypothetical protein
MDVTDPKRSIRITHGSDGYVVTVQPTDDGIEPELLPTHREAKGWASGLRLARGGQIVDECGGGHE